MSHAKLSPSSSERWINCPASIQLTESATREGIIAPDQSSVFAREGTVAHTLAEMCLRGGEPTITYEGYTSNADDVLLEPDADIKGEITIDREMCEYVQEYIDYVNLEAAGSPVKVEQRVEFTDWVPDGFGTSDAVIIKGSTITCVDLKYGRGVMVSARDNTQAILYALGVYQSLSHEERANVTKVKVVIHQPRLDHVSEWELSLDELLAWGEKIAIAAERTFEDNPPMNTGNWCRFCPVISICKAQDQLLVDTLGADFENLESVGFLSDSRLSEVLKAKETITTWLAAVENHVAERLISGESFEGFKMVAGRSSRRWANESEAADVLETILGDKAYSTKLLSPAQAEKALGKKSSSLISDMIVKVSGNPTLVPESDPRESVNISVDDFD